MYIIEWKDGETEVMTAQVFDWLLEGRNTAQYSAEFFSSIIYCSEVAP